MVGPLVDRVGQGGKFAGSGGMTAFRSLLVGLLQGSFSRV